MPILKPALKMVKFPPRVEVRDVDAFCDEPDPFMHGVEVVPCPKAKPSARQRGLPLIQVNAQGDWLSTGTVWAGAPHADGARPTTAESPLRPASEPPRGSGNCAGPIPDGPPVTLSPRLDAGTGPVEGKPCTAPPAQKCSSGDPLRPIQPPLIFARSPQTRARSSGRPPPFGRAV